mmetsp:Transcript_6172/g.7114  ORF Transcript_6172/g.7114 Transcript_6172/m.7114 type:complete len:381 (+) Transcript_6172:103-1245(+)|eukprot:CAMPEP_0204642108 /NCGR_PEP_ID=MMETSP0717-20131115/51509_1 /ASSEMBLY_ACC=CAM_ASM_000666 /TAXON_ID=230516 /ORGANISM="Chaetoceros curvisetus" /LENGTH=380 /DNA_ID=CAMNT_0051662853 /DNA_START=21 /DNA_END=1163 /DNA_ORIENTATION=+
MQVEATVLPFNPKATAPVATRHYQISSGKSYVGSEEVKALRSQGFTTGLAESFADVKTTFPLRIWVIDNSGSMQKVDGHRIVSTRTKNDMKIVDCTRWDEIKEAVTYHIQMSALLEASTSFRLLNNPGIAAGPQQFDIAQMGKEMIQQEVTEAVNIMTKVRPGGVTPLTQHIQEIHSTISGLRSSLEMEGKKVAVIIATDGLPTDAHGHSNKTMQNQFVQSLRLLEGLPVWLVIRLCTDDDEVVQFYNDLDDQLEISMDVLDDFVGEAEEVYEHNKWLNYALPLHRMREMGFHDRVFDMLDERTLTKSELRDFCRLLFGIQNFDGVADPSEDWPSFLGDVERLLKKEELQYDPVKKKMMPWINLKKLHKIYGDDSACTIM